MGPSWSERRLGGATGHSSAPSLTASVGLSLQVPESMRTLKDVLAVIQRIMKLDKRFLYARQLFLPDGEVVTSYRALAAAASNDTPVTVCVDMESLRVPKVGPKAARPLTSVSSPEASLSVRSRLRAARSFGPPRPISRLGRAGRPYRACFTGLVLDRSSLAAASRSTRTACRSTWSWCTWRAMAAAPPRG